MVGWGIGLTWTVRILVGDGVLKRINLLMVDVRGLLHGLGLAWAC